MWLNHSDGDEKADFSWISQLCVVSAFLPQLSLSLDSYNSQYTSVFKRIHTLHDHFPSWFLQFITCPQSQKSSQSRTSLLNWPLMQCKANVFKVLLICFFFLLLKVKKYCSFKYCALHRIFCHKLVNIYIFHSFFNIQTYTFIYTGQ